MTCFYDLKVKLIPSLLLLPKQMSSDSCKGGGVLAVGDMDLKQTGANQTHIYLVPITGSPIAYLFFCIYRITEKSSFSVYKGFIRPYVKYITIIT